MRVWAISVIIPILPNRATLLDLKPLLMRPLNPPNMLLSFALHLLPYPHFLGLEACEMTGKPHNRVIPSFCCCFVLDFRDHLNLLPLPLSLAIPTHTYISTSCADFLSHCYSCLLYLRTFTYDMNETRFAAFEVNLSIAFHNFEGQRSVLLPRIPLKSTWKQHLKDYGQSTHC